MLITAAWTYVIMWRIKNTIYGGGGVDIFFLLNLLPHYWLRSQGDNPNNFGAVLKSDVSAFVSVLRPSQFLFLWFQKQLHVEKKLKKS